MLGLHCSHEQNISSDKAQQGHFELILSVDNAEQGPCQPRNPGQLHCPWSLWHPTPSVLARKGEYFCGSLSFSRPMPPSLLSKGACLPCQDCAKPKQARGSRWVCPTCWDHRPQQVFELLTDMCPTCWDYRPQQVGIKESITSNWYISLHRMLNGETIRLDGAIRMQP